jgi:hypothetical protein
MKISELKNILKGTQELTFKLPDGSLVPNHFHVTEIGKIDKNFIDCGGTIRQEQVVNFHLWTADDYDHRIAGETLLNIIQLSEDKLNIGDHEIEVEYQGATIGKYGLNYAEGTFLLEAKMTDCLAKDNCGIPDEKPRFRISAQNQENSCAPGSGCC